MGTRPEPAKKDQADQTAGRARWVENPTSAAGRTWFALSVTPQHEKAVFHELKDLDVGADPFCPMVVKMTRTKLGRTRRKERRQFALLPSYVFIGYHDQPDFMVVDDIGSVRGFVGFDRSPSRIPANQIQRLMDDEANGIHDTPPWEEGMEQEAISYEVGTKMRVDLPGVEGEVFEILSSRKRRHILRAMGLEGAREITVTDARWLEVVG